MIDLFIYWHQFFSYTRDRSGVAPPRDATWRHTTS